MSWLIVSGTLQQTHEVLPQPLPCFFPGVYNARIQYLHLTFPEVVVVSIFCYTVFQEKLSKFQFCTDYFVQK